MPHDTGWFKSSYSAGSNNDCVEVRITTTRVGVRDSKNPHGPRLTLPTTAWTAFLARL
ncbi:DUF397 domain-containing protein [Saccharothrix coeruleofusca]|uniref:DUF397 domain-containing protein n=1 Tax=Saccharothrix coeruleofusca TaxID=33919 RepID=A0A918API7_9PSEU|nr:DUF397 domain-containing protein [Saccharothrix coeruleofusca]GGP66907.1 hypothetical protein GCM10010185_44680 [Saccharothrix coeruleofusca]